MLIDVTNGSEQQIVSEVVGFRVTNAAFPPLRKLESHYHERACLAIVLDGGIESVVPRPQRSMARSTAVMIPPAEMHLFSYDGGGTQMLFIEPNPAAPAAEETVHPYAELLERVHHRAAWRWPAREVATAVDAAGARVPACLVPGAD